jgi:hypothetical protein
VFFTLIFELTDIVWLTHYYRTGTSLISTPSFCLTWVFIDFTLHLVILDLVAWASVERHILIFHTNWLATPRKRFLIHYLPLIIFCIYPSLFYVYVFFIQSCDVVLNYTARRCGYSNCISVHPITAMIDSVANNFIPTFIIIIFSIVLLIRVLYQRYRVHRQIRWANYIKMATQLLSISAIYFVLYVPFALLFLAYTCGLSMNTGADFFAAVLYFSYYPPLLIPFVSAAQLPEFKQKCRRIFTFWHRPQRRIGPEILNMTRLVNGRTVAVVPVG